MNTKKLILFTYILITALLLAGCGGNPATGDATATPAGDVPLATEKPSEQEIPQPAGATDAPTATPGADEMDPFEFITVSFEGISPKGKLKMQVDSSRPETAFIEYEASRIGVLAEGDEITVTAKLTVEDQKFTDRFGKVLSPTTRVYKVTGLQSYIQQLSDVGAELMAQMQAQAEDVIASEVATWKNGRLRGTEYLGCYMLTAKDGYKTDNRNMIKFIYKISATAVYESFSQDVDYYYGVTFYNMLETAGHQNQTVNLTYYDKNYTYNGVAVDTGYTYYGLKLNVYFQGYPTLDALYAGSVARSVNKYNVESTVADR